MRRHESIDPGRSHTFTNGVTLMTGGSQRITATEIRVLGLNGTADVKVSARTTCRQTSRRLAVHSGQLDLFGQ